MRPSCVLVGVMAAPVSLKISPFRSAGGRRVSRCAGVFSKFKPEVCDTGTKGAGDLVSEEIVEKVVSFRLGSVVRMPNEKGGIFEFGWLVEILVRKPAFFDHTPVIWLLQDEIGAWAESPLEGLWLDQFRWQFWAVAEKQ